jgi:hypothetical protein
MRLETRSKHSWYDVQVVVSAGFRMLIVGGDSTWSHIRRHSGTRWSKNDALDTAETALHRAFAKINASRTLWNYKMSANRHNDAGKPVGVLRVER